MFNLRNVGSNQTTLTLSDGTEIFFSYNTPVAAFIPGKGYIKTTKKWSKTTSKHINAYAENGEPVEQSELDALIS